MNKKFLFPCLAVFLLACSVISPFTAATPITQVVFRSPRDMNLQPQDVPDLKETNVENPATQPLLPEAIDQDQRAYVSVTQSIYIESNAIMVPERTKRKPREIVDEVVRHRRPKANVENTETPVSVGNAGAIITINNFCSSDYSEGLILIVLRENMVIVLIGCGSDITQDYILHLGELIDAHITAPPQPNEVASSDILTTTSEAPIETIEETSTPNQPAECIKLNLSPELCSNYGYHSYSVEVTSVGPTPQDCQEPGSDTGTIYLQIVRESGEVKYPWSNSYTLSSSGGNAYTFEFHYSGQGDTGENIDTFVLYIWGFTYESKEHWAGAISDRRWVCAAKYTITK